MMQYFTLRLCRESESSDVTFDEVAKRTYDTIEVFRVLEQKYQPNYATVWRKKDAKLFDWSYENFCKHLKESVNREGDLVFEDLGRTCGFFSSLKNHESLGYMFTVGTTNPKFINTFKVNFPIEFDYFDEKMSKKMEDIFRQAVKVFEPFWGCMENSLITNESKCFNEDMSFPTEFHWLNYLSDDMMSKVNPKAVKKLAKKYNEFECKDNIIKLQNIALNAHSPEDVKLKNDVDKALAR